MTATEDLPQLPFKLRDVLDVASTYRTLRAEQRVARVRTMAGDQAWLVTGYEDVRRMFTDERLGRSHPRPEQAARVSNSVLLGGPMGEYETEKAEHDQFRRLLTPSFSARRMKALSEHVQAIVDELLDRLAASSQPADLHEGLSFPLPALVICELLGVPYADREQFRAWSTQMADMTDLEQATEGKEQLGAYMLELIAAKRRAPAEDVISDLAAAAAEDGDLTDDRVAELASGLLFAGHETTVSRIDYGTVLLLTHPEQRDALRRDPELAPAAVEEILRIAAPTDHGLTRYAHADIDIGGVTIRAGDAVIIMPEAANRDEETFPDPDRFDITRELGDPHVAFGYGPRFCIGANLARVELRAVFGTLFRRFPDLALAMPFDELRRLPGRLIGGFAPLPVTW